MAEAKDVFTQHQQEIRRRTDVVRMQESVNPGVFERVEDERGSDFPFVLEGQAWVLFSVSHAEMPPVAPDPRRPAVRLYGTFATPEGAVAHAKQVQAVDPSVNLQMAKTHEWIVARSAPSRISPEGDAAHVEEILRAYADSRARSTTEFEDNVRNAKGGGPAQTGEAQEEDDEAPRGGREEASEAESAATQGRVAASALPRSAEVRGQTLAVASFVAVRLHEACPVFLFRVDACFDTQADADRYVRNTASCEVRDFDLDVVSLCEWLHAQQAEGSKLQSEVFRAPELQSIIANHKSQPQQVAAFERWRNRDETGTPAAKMEAREDGAANTEVRED